MKKKDYQSIKVIEITQFDNVAYAQSELEKCEKKVKLGMILTLCALPFTLIMLFVMGNRHMGDIPVLDFLGPVIMVFALGAMLIGVIMVGVLGIIFRLGKKVIYWCWMLVPVFPFDLCAAVIGGAMIAMSILIVPALYLVMGTYAAYREKCDATAFLAMMMAEASQEQANTAT